MSTNSQSIVSAGVSPVPLSQVASFRVDPDGADPASGEKRIPRVDRPAATVSETVDRSTSKAPEEGSPEETSCHAVAEVVHADPLETILAAQDVQADDPEKSRRQLPLPPTYVDAAIGIVSRSREEVIEELGRRLDHRTRQLRQAANMIQNLVREKNELQSKVVRLDRVRGNLNQLHTALRGVHHEILNRETTR